MTPIVVYHNQNTIYNDGSNGAFQDQFDAVERAMTALNLAPRTYDTFHPFRRLPIELRTRIWRECQFARTFVPYIKGDDTARAQNVSANCITHITAMPFVPPVLRVCSESRKETIGNYVLRPARAFNDSLAPTRLARCRQYIYMHPERDVLLIGTLGQFRGQNWPHRSLTSLSLCFKGFGKIAMRCDYFEGYLGSYDEVCKSFWSNLYAASPELSAIILVLSNPGWAGTWSSVSRQSRGFEYAERKAARRDWLLEEIEEVDWAWRYRWGQPDLERGPEIWKEMLEVMKTRGNKPKAPWATLPRLEFARVIPAEKGRYSKWGVAGVDRLLSRY